MTQPMKFWQIGYAVPYRSDQRQVYRIGVGLCQQQNGIAEWKAE